VAGLGLLLATALLTAPRTSMTRSTERTAAVPTETALAIVQARCSSCHARQPSQPGFTAPPMGVVLESADDLALHRERIRQAVVTRTMPLANLTGMTDEERQSVVDWTLSD
jgi:uncharacterized membrane protein